MITNTLIFLAELSWELGLIGIDELEERTEIALWLSDERHGKHDPRFSKTENDFEKSPKDDFNSSLSNGEASFASPSVIPKDEDNFLEFVAWKTWYFTGSDPDSYPSVPHGHFQNANNKWPKLNPYTGRVFSLKNKEDNSKRLTKKDMQTLWGDVEFRNFCRAHIVWYMKNHSHYRFSVRNPLRFPRR